jgi:hypothetical protein
MAIDANLRSGDILVDEAASAGFAFLTEIESTCAAPTIDKTVYRFGNVTDYVMIPE